MNVEAIIVEEDEVNVGNNTGGIPTSITGAIAISNVLAEGSQAGMISDLAMSNAISNMNASQQNALSNQQNLNQVNMSVTAKSSGAISRLSPLEARSSVDVLTNNELAQAIADLKASIKGLS
ncbi:MAG: hypothetical protein NE327_20805 [Lentisphaeraceae bacterium]|nr:hypothetical protein [Lentisphaeraceae bacterium]